MMPARRHMQRIASMPCMLCDAEPPSTVHHIRTGQGASQRASDFLSIPLCKECHQGKGGIHGDRALLRVMKWTEMDLLAFTIEALMRKYDAP